MQVLRCREALWARRVRPGHPTPAGLSLRTLPRTGVIGQSTAVAVAAPPTVLTLPKLSEDVLKPEVVKELKDVLSAPLRKADVDIYYPDSFGSGNGKVNAIIFGHGFFQPAGDYDSKAEPAVIEDLRKAGYVVVAPRTEVQDVVGRDIEIKVDGFISVSLPGKLQAALIIDMLRSRQLLAQHDLFKDRVDKVAFVGHSLGGACSIITAGKIKADLITGVVALSPEVRSMQKTVVNDDIWVLNGDEASLEAAEKYFRDEFAPETPLVIVSPDKDGIAVPADLRRLFEVATAARGVKENVGLFPVPGGHFGYETKLDVPVRYEWEGASIWGVSLAQFEGTVTAIAKLANASAVKLWEFVLYLIHGKQAVYEKRQALAIMTQALVQGVFAGTRLDQIKYSFAPDDGPVEKPIFDSDPSVRDRAGLLANLLQRARRNTEANPQLTAALAALAAAQLAGTAVAGSQLASFAQGLTPSGGSSDTQLGLLILTVLTLGFAYDNAVLAAGRYIGSLQGEPASAVYQQEKQKQQLLLLGLSKWRFLFYSAAPLAVITGLDVADRAGVEWAGDPVTKGLLGVAILLLVGASSIHNAAFLQLNPRWTSGILRYSFDSAVDWTRVIPLAAATVTLGVLGVQATQQDGALWPLVVGPVFAALLNVLPGQPDGAAGANKDAQPGTLQVPLPQFVLRNIGSLALLGSLVLSEVILNVQGR